MLIEVVRKYETKNSTIGHLYIDGEFQCYTLEDPGRKKKIWGKTRIWAGEYSVAFRKVGGFHARYKKRFSRIHKGMLHILNVKLFEYILIHIGNTPDDTNGCILVGSGYGRDTITDSTKAYIKIYPKIARALESGEPVTIKITDDQIDKVV